MPFNVVSSDGEQPVINLQIDKFDGINRLVKDARAKPSEAVEALNLWQVEDGVWSPRPGTAQYGSSLPGSEESVINGAAEYVTTNANMDEVRQIVCVIDGDVYTSATNGASWNKLTGVSFDTTARVRFLQLGELLYIFNGIDDLVTYDGTALAKYSGISAPASLSGTRGSGLSAGNYTQYYQVTAINDVGETEPTAEYSITTNKERSSWSAGSSENITLTWPAVANAVGYQVYWADVAGHECFMARVTTNSFTDDNTQTVNPFVETPDDNTTSAPKFTSAWISDNAIWATGDKSNPYRVYRTGTGVNLGSFSSFYDGFWLDLEPGGREKPRTGRHYQSGQGEGRSTVFCSTPEGTGSVWQIQIGTATVGEDTFSVPSAYKIIGSVGTDAVDGVVAVENDIFFPNRQGVYALGMEKNYFGILRTNNLATMIIEYWRALPGGKIKDLASYYWNNKVLISVSQDGNTNTRTVIFDRERNRWYADWSIGFRSFFEYTDTSGTSHLIGIHERGNYLTEISESILGDMDEPFKCIYRSGRIPLDKEWNRFGKVKKVYLKFGRPRGSIKLTVYGTSKKKGFLSLVSRDITSSLSPGGLGWDLVGETLLGWTTGKPVTFTQSNEIRYLKINKKIRDIQFQIESESMLSQWTLLGIKVKGFLINTSDPSAWKLRKA